VIANRSTRHAFDWRQPEYVAVFQERVERLARLRANPQSLPALKLFYKDHPAQFITDWGVTYDPRNPERGLPANIPFLLFPKQVGFIEWVLARWMAGEPGLCEKSRDMGVSWLAMGLSCALCLFHQGLTIGIGSRKESLLDNAGDPNSLFFKARMFLQNLPVEFLNGWTLDNGSAHMRLVFPESQCAITGEAGDQIGRGGRTSIFFVDEAAYIERSELIEASLSATTNCRIDMSSVNGMANAFAVKRHSGKVPVFQMHWRSDPRKDDAWYAKQCHELPPTVVASEIDLDYMGSVEGQLIPSAWVNSAIGAAQRLGIEPTGHRYAALDVADEGRDSNCFSARHGIALVFLRSWSGKDSDIYKTVQKAFRFCDELGFTSLAYDSDGLGAGCRGDANVINELRDQRKESSIHATPFRGSAAVWRPDSEIVPKRKNKDMFANAKAQAWWSLRMRFEQTHRAVVQKMPVDVDAIISIDPSLDELAQLQVELSQITYSINASGKIVIDKQPPGTLSPNRADSVNIVFSPQSRALEVWAKLAE
jgi:phage terminase large subunit